MGERRFESFRNWPGSDAVTPEELSDAGFHYVGPGDRVQCQECDLQLENWIVGDSPRDSHWTYNPRCAFFLAQPHKFIPSGPKWHSERPRINKDTDCLDYEMYGIKLGEMILDKKTRTPLTIGIFANWGQGKTAIIELVEEYIKDNNSSSIQERKVTWGSSLCCLKTGMKRILCFQYLLLMLTFAVALAAIFILFNMASPTGSTPSDTYNSTQTNVTSISIDLLSINIPWEKILIALIPVMFIVLVFFLFGCCLPNTKGYNCFNFKSFIMLFFYLSKREEHGAVKRPVRVIQVNFNAWQYAGCDRLWAGIASNLHESIIKYLGKWRCMCYRFVNPPSIDATQDIDSGNCHFCCYGNGNLTDDNKHCKTQKKDIPNNKDSVENSEASRMLKEEERDIQTERKYSQEDIKNFVIPYSHCKVPRHLLLTIFILLIIILICTISVHVKLGSLTNLTKIISGVVAVCGVFAAINGLIGIKKMLTDPLSQIKKLNRRHMDIERGLGVMHNIKKEITRLTEMVKYMQWLDDIEYRVLITVDDLDRCEKERVVELLEAISILLSESNTPYISLIAVDPRIVIRAIDAKMKEKMNVINERSTVNGHEYLKKIIHLPFWLPDADDEKIAKLLENMREKSKSHVTVIPETATATQYANAAVQSAPSQEKEKKIEAYNEALELLISNRKLLSNNPRSVKRISNVLSLAMRLWTQHHGTGNVESIEHITWLLVMAEQWPYRLSLLLQIACDNDFSRPYTCSCENDPLKSTLLQTYNDNSTLLNKPAEWDSFLTFDLEETKFLKILEKNSSVTLKQLKDFQPFIINLERSIVESFRIAMVKERLEIKRELINGKAGSPESVSMETFVGNNNAKRPEPPQDLNIRNVYMDKPIHSDGNLNNEGGSQQGAISMATASMDTISEHCVKDDLLETQDITMATASMDTMSDVKDDQLETQDLTMATASVATISEHCVKDDHLEPQDIILANFGMEGCRDSKLTSDEHPGDTNITNYVMDNVFDSNLNKDEQLEPQDINITTFALKTLSDSNVSKDGDQQVNTTTFTKDAE